ncbi:MAG: O-antigen ligase family protein [Chloroflexi bacterium]|nr:O-antigen ligase family protein [Chloroflexota bacterium]
MPFRLTLWTERIAQAVILLPVALVPLYFDTYTTTTFDPNKFLLTSGLAAFGALAALLYFLERSSSMQATTTGKEGSWWRGRPYTPILIITAILLVAYVFSVITSVSPRVSFWGSYLRRDGLLAFLVYLLLGGLTWWIIRNWTRLLRLFTTMLLASVPVSLFGIMQHFNLDPIHWSDDLTQRVGSTLGWPVFIAAYLIMVIPITLLFLWWSWRGPMDTRPGSQPGRQWGSVVLYSGILVLQLLALFFTQSRGPTMGLAAGLGIGLLVLVAYKAKRTIAYLFIVGAAALVLFLALFNLPDSPLPKFVLLRPFQRIFLLNPAMSGEAQWRLNVWRSSTALLKEDPARLLTGYGPESLYVIFNRVYPQGSPPGLLADRAHNETLDNLIRSGILGLVAFLGLYLTIFFQALRALGLAPSARSRSLYLLCTLGTGLLGLAGVWLIGRGTTLSWLAGPLGMIAGLGLYLLIQTFVKDDSRQHLADRQLSLDQQVLLALFIAFVAHFVEVQFSFNVVVTHLHFWVFVGIMLRLLMNPLPADAPFSVAAPAQGKRTMPSRKGSKLRDARRGIGEGTPSFRGIAGVALLLAVLLTLTYSFFNRQYEPWTQPALMGLFAATWLTGLLLLISMLQLDNLIAQNMAGSLPTLAQASIPAGNIVLAGIGILVVLLVYAMLHWAAMAPESDVGQGFRLYIIWFIFLLALLIFTLGLEEPVPTTQWLHRPVTPLAVFLGCGMIIFYLVWGIVRPMNADAYYTWGSVYEKFGRPADAQKLYEQAVNLAPEVDRYHTYLGGLYGTQGLLNGANSQNFLKASEQELLKARTLNPLDPDHMVNLANLYYQWGVETTDPTQQIDLLRKSRELMLQVTDLSPNNHGIKVHDQLIQNTTLLADILLRTGRLPEASQMYREALTLNGEVLVRDRQKLAADAPENILNLESLLLIYGERDKLADMVAQVQAAREKPAGQRQTTLENMLVRFKSESPAQNPAAPVQKYKDLANLRQVVNVWRMTSTPAAADLDHDGRITVADIMLAAATLEPAGN